MIQKNIFPAFPILFAVSLGCSSETPAGDGGETGGTGATTGGSGGTTGGTSSAGTSGSSSGGTGGGTSCGTALIANPANNYSFRSTLSFPPVAVMPGTELTFDWSAVSEDFMGHAMNAQTDVAQVNVMLWVMPQAALEQELNDDTLAQRDLAIGGMYPTGGMTTTANLFDFVSFAGAEVTPDEFRSYLDPVAYPPESNTYTAMIASSTTVGNDTRMIQAFKLDPASTNTTVTITNDSTTLDWMVDLVSHTRTQVPVGQPAITIDWVSMDEGMNALGNTFIANSITEALVARYTQTPEELEDQFLSIELIAADMYRGNIASGTSADLSTFTNEAGQTFPGIDATSTWVLALICGECRNPAPWYLTVLTPCAQ